SGKYKDMASVFRGVGREEREILQGVMDDVHEQFIAAVAEGRKMPVEKVRPIADGRIFSGRQAIQAGLVDELGDLDHAVRTAARMAGIRGEPEVVSKKEKSPILDLLSGRLPEGLAKIIPRLELKYIYLQ
ncbi:MAG: S49 family peptidase, partial [Nitrospirales bacterium]|nr:S49 family peptidase [Nitrospirales bacterium]